MLFIYNNSLQRRVYHVKIKDLFIELSILMNLVMYRWVCG